MDHYIHMIQNTQAEQLYNIPHIHMGAHPTGFVVITDSTIQEFHFTICPLHFCKAGETHLPGKNPHDVILYYKEELGSLEKILYILWEQYKDEHCNQTEYSMKRYVFEKRLPPRKMIIPCLHRKENLLTVLKRFDMIDLPSEGYKPQMLLVEHSPNPEMKEIAEEYNCEWIWFFLDPRFPEMPLGQFNKALAYDKAFLYGSSAEWYLFHDNDVIVPKDFWAKLDANMKRANTKFIQPYTHRSLLNLLPHIAERLRSNLELADLPLESSMYYPISAGAPGGSLYIHRDRYIEVGGHDPNINWGYGPEDAMFFNKLQVFETIAFADDPPIEMLHLWHPTAAVNNPLLQCMNFFVKQHFSNLSVDEKKAYMLKKKEQLIAAIRT